MKIRQSRPVFCSQEISSWRRMSCKQFPPVALQVAKKYCERVTPPLQLAMFFSRHRCETSCKKDFTCNTPLLQPETATKCYTRQFFLQLVSQHFVAVAGCKSGVLRVKSFLQLVSQQKVARKIASCNMAFTGNFRDTLISRILGGHISRHLNFAIFGKLQNHSHLIFAISVIKRG